MMMMIMMMANVVMNYVSRWIGSIIMGIDILAHDCIQEREGERGRERFAKKKIKVIMLDAKEDLFMLRFILLWVAHSSQGSTASSMTGVTSL